VRRILPLLGLVLALAVAPLGAGAAQDAPAIEDRLVIRSADGTPIVATLMLPAGASAEAPVPAILQTHGWGGSRQRRPGGTSGILLERGYAILTWDSRGFGESGGEANVAAPEFEVRDAQALIDYLALRPEIAKERRNDPLVGWIGGSNAAGVQLNTAAVDDRIDAIAPEIPWGDLVQDLIPNGVPKVAWDELLYAAGFATAQTAGLQSPAGTQLGAYAKEIHLGHAQIVATGELSSDISAWYAHRSTVRRADQITAPTLIVQGSIDTLFPLEDAFDLYRLASASSKHVKLMAYCSGHSLVGCRYPGGRSGYPQGKPAGVLDVWQQRIVDWMDRWVKDDERVDTGPAVEWQAQDGIYYGARSFPLPRTEAVAGVPMTTGTLTGPGATGGDGAANGAPAPSNELGRTASRAVVLPAADEVRPILGVPTVQLTGTVQGLTAHAFFELVDVAPDGTRVTLDDQTMPLKLGNGSVNRSFDLHGIAWMLQPGHALELEVTTGSAQYAVPRTGPYTVNLTAQVTFPIS
jgi:ABC-2 type transport system ATP-binding protein